MPTQGTRRFLLDARDEASGYLGRELTDTEWAEAYSPATQKLSRIIQLYGDNGGDRRQPWYLGKLVQDSYQYMKLREAKIAELEAQDVIDIYANGDVIDTSPQSLPGAPTPELPAPSQGFEVNHGTGEITKEPVPAASTGAPQPTAGATTADGQTTIGGPSF